MQLPLDINSSAQTLGVLVEGHCQVMLVPPQSLSGAGEHSKGSREVWSTLLTRTLLRNSNKAKQEEHSQALPVAVRIQDQRDGDA